MKATEKLALLADLSNTFCEFCKNQACNYIVIPVGRAIDAVTHEATRELVVPICQECISSILSPEWLLFYCLACTSHVWCNRKFAKLEYRECDQILFFGSCPGCSDKLSGLYFLKGEHQFLEHQHSAGKT